MSEYNLPGILAARLKMQLYFELKKKLFFLFKRDISSSIEMWSKLIMCRTLPVKMELPAQLVYYSIPPKFLYKHHRREEKENENLIQKFAP